MNPHVHCPKCNKPEVPTWMKSAYCRCHQTKNEEDFSQNNDAASVSMKYHVGLKGEEQSYEDIRIVREIIPNASESEVLEMLIDIRADQSAIIWQMEKLVRSKQEMKMNRHCTLSMELLKEKTNYRKETRYGTNHARKKSYNGHILGMCTDFGKGKRKSMEEDPIPKGRGSSMKYPKFCSKNYIDREMKPEEPSGNIQSEFTYSTPITNSSPSEVSFKEKSLGKERNAKQDQRFIINKDERNMCCPEMSSTLHQVGASKSIEFLDFGSPSETGTFDYENGDFPVKLSKSSSETLPSLMSSNIDGHLTYEMDQTANGRTPEMTSSAKTLRDRINCSEKACAFQSKPLLFNFEEPKEKEEIKQKIKGKNSTGNRNISNAPFILKRIDLVVTVIATLVSLASLFRRIF